MKDEGDGVTIVLANVNAPAAVALKRSASTYEGRLRGLLEPAEAGFVPWSRGVYAHGGGIQAIRQYYRDGVTR